MPIRRFWLLESNVSRISAERDLRALQVSMGSQHGDSARTLTEGLARELGVVVVTEELDRSGVGLLRSMQHQKKGDLA